MNEHAMIRHSNKPNTHAYKQHKQANQNIKEKKVTTYQKKKLEI
jgi:tRNA A37 methylthiotransferase MiaB